MPRDMDLSVKTIDEFISKYPDETQAILQKIRQIVHEVCPDSSETIAYGIPTFTFHGNLVHFSAYDKHIGFYPGSAPIAAFKDDLKPYETSKGTARFPLDKPIPYDLIKKMTKYAIDRNLEKKK